LIEQINQQIIDVHHQLFSSMGISVGKIKRKSRESVGKSTRNGGVHGQIIALVDFPALNRGYNHYEKMRKGQAYCNHCFSCHPMFRHRFLGTHE